jgi:hypothetical protein
MLVLMLLIEIEPFEHEPEHDYEQESHGLPENLSRDKAWTAGTRS